jgi:hypothetical protein
MSSATIPPPLSGWNTLDALVGMDGGCAPTLDNLLPDAGRLLMRAGYRAWATGLPGRVDGLLAYRSGSLAFLFAGSGTGIFDVTAPGAVGAAVVTGASSATWDGVMMAAGGGNFLLAFNGTSDTPRTFNGAAWANWTGTGGPAAMSWAGVHQSTLFVGDRTQLAFWYGAAASIGGTFTQFPLQGVARLGGGVAGMIAWTHDGGAGPDDYAVFLTTEGEVIVYKGTNPSSSTTWSLVGVWSLPRPIGNRFLRPYGGDVLILTEGGVFPLSSLTSSNYITGSGGTDSAALAAKAFTRKIEPTFLALTRGRGAQAGWGLVPLASYGVWLVNMPWGSTDAQQVAFRAVTGACCRFVGLPAACWLEAGGRAYFGSASTDPLGSAGGGIVYLWGEDDTDNGAAIACEAVQAFADFDAPGRLKRFTLLQPILSDQSGAAVKVAMCLDWRVPTPDAELGGAGAAKATPTGTQLIWDSGNWDEMNWAGESEVSRAWYGVTGLGMAGAVRLRVTSVAGRVGWLGTGAVWEQGGALR